MASEKPKYIIKPIAEIQQPFFGMANDYQFIIEDLKKSKETILKLEIQLKAANDTIIQQENQLVQAKTILSQVDKLEGNSRQTIDQLKEDLDIERRGRRAAEEKVQQLGEQVENLKTLTKVEVDQGSHERENIADNFQNNSMEIDDLNCSLVNSDNDKFKESDEVYSSTVIIGDEIFKNAVENDEVHCSLGKNGNDGSFKTELQIIESTLLKYVNKLVAKENKPYKRQKCLNKVIQTTEKLVSSLSTMVSEEWVSYKIQTPSTPQSSPPSPLPFLYSPIQLWSEKSIESLPAPPPQLLTVPSSSTTTPTVIPDEKSFTENIGVRHEIDIHKNNKCLCGHESTNQEALLKHISREVNGKVFKCELCDNRSRDTSDLNLHYQKVHKIKSDYANGCGKCGKTFATRRNLTKHLSLHKQVGKVFDASAIRIRAHH